MNTITSKDNKIIKNYLKLVDKKSRDKHGLYLDFGIHALSEVKDKSLIVEVISQDPTIATICTTTSILKLFQNNKSIIDPVIVLKKPIPSDNYNNVVFLDGIQIPDNIGAICRNCLAFGIDTIIVNEKCADPYSEKCLRAAQGAISKLNIISTNNSQLTLTRLQEKNFQIFTTLLDNNSRPLERVNYSNHNCFVFGSEGQGIDSTILPTKTNNLYIPIQDINSLNVAVAVGIILYDWSTKR